MQTEFNFDRAGDHGPNPPRHRNGGPTTSREAAESLSEDYLGQLCRQVLDVIIERGPFGATTDEICVELYGSLEAKPSISRRITDLAQAGKVVMVGKRPGLRSGRNQQAWAVR